MAKILNGRWGSEQKFAPQRIARIRARGTARNGFGTPDHRRCYSQIFAKKAKSHTDLSKDDFSRPLFSLACHKIPNPRKSRARFSSIFSSPLPLLVLYSHLLLNIHKLNVVTQTIRIFTPIYFPSNSQVNLTIAKQKSPHISL